MEERHGQISASEGQSQDSLSRFPDSEDKSTTSVKLESISEVGAYLDS